MLKQDQIDSLSTNIRVAQIIAIALTVGVLVAGCVFASLVPWGETHTRLTVMAAVGVFFAISSAVLAMVLPRIIEASAARVAATEFKHSDGKTLSVQGLKTVAQQFQTTQIMKMAIIEGAAFLNILIFFIDKSQLALIAAGVCVLLLVFSFPTANKFISSVENQLDRIQENMRAA